VTLAAQRKSLGPDHPEVAGTLVDLGFLYLNERRYAEADAALEESLRIYRALNSVDAANSLRIMAVSLLTQERYAEARRRIDECLALARERYGPSHQVTLTALGNLGDIQLHAGEVEAAEATLREAIAGLEGLFGPESDNLRGPLNNLGEAARRRGRIDEAESLHRRALAIQLKALGPGGPSLPGTRLQLALDLLARPAPPSLSQAREQLDLALELQRRIDANHPRLDEMLLASAEAAREAGDLERSRRELAEAFERLERHHGSADARTRRAGAELAALRRSEHPLR
jgi:tetratricopeptide (TPR) repeat protein